MPIFFVGCWVALPMPKIGLHITGHASISVRPYFS
jgi:hypothetical protein